MDRLHELLQFILGLTEEAVKISQLPGKDRDQDDEIDILCLNHGNGCQAEYGEEEYNADKYAKFESFKHDNG